MGLLAGVEPLLPPHAVMKNSANTGSVLLSHIIEDHLRPPKNGLLNRLFSRMPSPIDVISILQKIAKRLEGLDPVQPKVHGLAP